MNIDQIRNRVRHIENLRRDDEAAHSEEALKTKTIDFARWCA